MDNNASTPHSVSNPDHFMKKLDYLEAGDINDNTGEPYSWFGRAWRNAAIAIANHISDVQEIVGGGVIGNLLAGLIEAGVEVLISLRPDAYVDPMDNNALTRAEQNQLNLYHRHILLPTITDIVKRVDDSIVMAIQNKGGVSIIASKINVALQQVAALRLYGSLIDEKGVVGSSTNYSSQLSALIVKMCDYTEKAIIIYAEKNAVDYKLIEERKDVSNVARIGKIQTNFSSGKAYTKIKSYVSKDIVLNDGQSTVTDVNTDPKDPTPATTNTSNGDDKKKPNILKTVGLVASLLGIAYLMKPKEGKKNKK